MTRYHLITYQEPTIGAVAPAGAWDSTTLYSGGIIEGDDFSGYADLAAAQSSWTTRFPDYAHSSGCSFDPVVTFGGRRTLKIPQSAGGPGSVYLELTKSGLSYTDVWFRTMFKIPSTFYYDSSSLLFGFLGGGGGVYPVSAQYRMNYGSPVGDGIVEKWRIEGPVDTAMALTAIQNRWVSVIVHHEITAGHPKQTLYIDGTQLSTVTDVTKTMTVYSTIDPDFDCEVGDAGVADPTNNFMHLGLFEYVDGVAHPNPYAL